MMILCRGISLSDLVSLARKLVEEIVQAETCGFYFLWG
jgi:hypothetical protein